MGDLSLTTLKASSPALAPPCFCTIHVSFALCPPRQHLCRWQQPILESLPRPPAFLALSSPGSLSCLQRKPTAAQQAHHTRLPRGGFARRSAWRVPAHVCRGHPPSPLVLGSASLSQSSETRVSPVSVLHTVLPKPAASWPAVCLLLLPLPSELTARARCGHSGGADCAFGLDWILPQELQGDV